MSMMTIERLHQLFDEHQDQDYLLWNGTCHDCSRETEVRATPMADGIHVEGGSVYEPEADTFFLKCEACFRKEPHLKKFQACEVYSRVVGYLRPVAQWNDAKRAEFGDRKLFEPSLK